MYLNRLIFAAAAISLPCLQPLAAFDDKEDGFLYEYMAAFPYLHLMQDIVWFISEQLDGEQTERVNQLIMDIGNINQLTQFVWSQQSDIRMIKIPSKRIYMSILITTGAEDPIMLAHDRQLTRRHYGMTFVVYTRKVDVDSKPICQLLYRLYRGYFVNSVVYFQTVQGQPRVYSFRMYPTFKMINSTDYGPVYRDLKKRISSASQNVQKYKFQTPLRQDIPGVFIVHDKKGREMVHGSHYSILKTFVKVLNGSLVPYKGPGDNSSNLTNIVNMKQILQLVRLKRIDMAAHAYALYQPDDYLDKSYPLMVVKWCLMVPLRNSISTFFYTLQPFEGKVWWLILAAFAAMCFKDCVGFMCESSSVEVLRSLWLNNVCHILNISPVRPVFADNLAAFLYYAVVFGFAFFLGALYTSFLGSSLTVSLFRAQINTLDDLIAANLSVMIIDYELEFLRGEGYQPSMEFAQLLRAVDSTIFYKHQIALNSSYAYFVTEDRWLFLHESQKHLKQKHFKFTDICFGSYHLAYPMQTDSPIWRDLKYYIFHLHSSGLFHMYERQALRYAFKGDNLERLEQPEMYASAGLEHLRVIFYMLGVMYAVAFVCLLGEMVYFRRGEIGGALKRLVNKW